MTSSNRLLISMKSSLDVIRDKGFEIAETAFDMSGVVSGVVKDIPMVSTAIAGLSIIDNYQIIKLKRNAQSFLQSIEDKNTEKVKMLFDRYMLDKQKENAFCETMLDILLYSPKVFKVQVLAGLVEAVANGKLTDSEFDQSSLLLSEASILSLQALQLFFESTEGQTHSNPGGIISVHPQEPMLNSLGVIGRYGSTVRITPLGVLLFKYGFKGEIVPEDSSTTNFR